MDNLTHSLLGALIGQTGLKRKTGLGMPALIIGANIPDLDAGCVVYGMESLAMRRGLTHGPLAMIVLPLALAAILYFYDRWQAKRGKRPETRLPVRFGWLFALSLIGCLSHPFMDWLNNYGIRLLEPFSHQWFYGDALFIIDLWLWVGMGLAVWLSLRRERRGLGWRWPAVTGMVLALGYIGFNLLQSQWALVNYAINSKGMTQPPVKIASAVPVLSWQRELIVGRPNEWFIVPAGAVPSPQNAKPISERRCAWPDTHRLIQNRPDLAAFLFWSRAPFVIPAESGKGIAFHDARYFDVRSRGRFNVELPDEPCQALPAKPLLTDVGGV